MENLISILTVLNQVYETSKEASDSEFKKPLLDCMKQTCEGLLAVIEKRKNEL